MTTAVAAPPFSYNLLATQPTAVGTARAGLFHTPHGDVPTPTFMPVGTQSTVKGCTWPQIKATGATMVLSNAYHLYLNPGPALIEKAGGLHGWMNWDQPILTDSGGFQVFSLAHLRKMTADGVTFKNPLNGDTHFIGPKESMAMQQAFGADVIMAFDECAPYPATREQVLASLDRTHRWLDSCVTHHHRKDQALFPIVQGGTYEDLREKSAAAITPYIKYGVAVGGVSVGEDRDNINRIVAHTTPLLPTHIPRYLMGVGTPEDLLMGVARGIDLFDCVMPTRIARHGGFFTRFGRQNIPKQAFTEDFNPLDDACTCWTCQHHSRAYIRHLYRQGENTAGTLMSIHNIHFLVQWMADARAALLAGTFNDFYHQRLIDLGISENDH
ncbi:MAG: tRNA guanosine(34) transglycosylase Tgt [Vampirovibrionales bacterium]|nr:tRNA guanosine(34) transglycosylase Tgt [Vampirovibrionales bacterium]